MGVIENKEKRMEREGRNIMFKSKEIVKYMKKIKDKGWKIERKKIKKCRGINDVEVDLIDKKKKKSEKLLGEVLKDLKKVKKLIKKMMKRRMKRILKIERFKKKKVMKDGNDGKKRENEMLKKMKERRKIEDGRSVVREMGGEVEKLKSIGGKKMEIEKELRDIEIEENNGKGKIGEIEKKIIDKKKKKRKDMERKKEEVKKWREDNEEWNLI